MLETSSFPLWHRNIPRVISPALEGTRNTSFIVSPPLIFCHLCETNKTPSVFNSFLRHHLPGNEVQIFPVYRPIHCRIIMVQGTLKRFLENYRPATPRYGFLCTSAFSYYVHVTVKMRKAFDLPKPSLLAIYEVKLFLCCVWLNRIQNLSYVIPDFSLISCYLSGDTKCRVGYLEFLYI